MLLRQTISQAICPRADTSLNLGQEEGAEFFVEKCERVIG